MLEESNAFTVVLLDLSSLQTHLYTILRITDWQHWVFVIAQVALVLSNLDIPMFILSMLSKCICSLPKFVRHFFNLSNLSGRLRMFMCM